MGTRFLSQKVILPAYKIWAALKMDLICSVTLAEVSEFIKEYFLNFVTSFGFKEEDVYKKLEFMPINTRKNTQVSPSKILSFVGHVVHRSIPHTFAGMYSAKP